MFNQYCRECKTHVPDALFRSSSSTICTPCLEALGAIIHNHVATASPKVYPPGYSGQRAHFAVRALGGLPIPNISRPADWKGRAKKAKKRDKNKKRWQRHNEYQQAKKDSNDFLKSQEWRRLRVEALHKFGSRCMACGASPTDGVTQINVDHVKPRKTHPELALDINNIQILCGCCNHGKGNRDFDFRQGAE